ncbi:MAG TPA: GntR family transcriptional regulator [Hyphomicrobiaceae bacterium]
MCEVARNCPRRLVALAHSSAAKASNVLTSRFSRRALYLQVRDALAARIATGEWRPGAVLPSENDLARELGVSPGTTRKALKLLEAERLVARRQGHGTFVIDPASPEGALRYSNICTRDGERIAGEVKVRPEDRVCHMQRLHLFNGAPFVVEEVFLLSALFPGLTERKDLSCPIGSLAQEFGILLGRAEERLSLGAVTTASAELLSLATGAPVLMLDRLIYAIDGTPVEWALRQVDLADKHYDNKLD